MPGQYSLDLMDLEGKSTNQRMHALLFHQGNKGHFYTVRGDRGGLYKGSLFPCSLIKLSSVPMFPSQILKCSLEKLCHTKS